MLENGSSRVCRCVGAVASLLAVAVLLASCGEKTTELDPGGDNLKFDKFCSIDGLSTALRHTDIIVDTTAVVAAPPEELRVKNPELFKLVVGLADPAGAVEAGATAPRERITLFAASPKTGVLTPVFTGCVPGASPSELADREAHGSGGAVRQYFGSDLKATISKDQDEFRRLVLLALAKLAKQAEPTGGIGTAAGGSPLVRLLRPLGPPPSDDPSVRRLFVFSNLDASIPEGLSDAGTARSEGFKDAEAAGLHLGLADVYLVPAGGPPSELSAQFLSAFILGSQGKLGRAGGFSASGLEPAPTQVINYRGTLSATQSIAAPMTLRLAATKDGQLVNSWISYTASFGQRSTPVSGQFTCTGDSQCELRSDPEGGLGQLWRIKPGPEPEVREDAPFGGLRFMEATETAQGLKGRISDPVISIGRPGGGMTFDAKRTKN